MSQYGFLASNSQNTPVLQRHPIWITLTNVDKFRRPLPLYQFYNSFKTKKKNATFWIPKSFEKMGFKNGCKKVAKKVIKNVTQKVVSFDPRTLHTI